MKKVILICLSLCFFFVLSSSFAECFEVPPYITNNTNPIFSMKNYESVLLPDTFSTYDPFMPFDHVTSINVSENNPHFSSKDGVLFSKNEDILIAYPYSRISLEYVIPEGVTILAPYSMNYWCSEFMYFENNESPTVYFPQSLIRIEEGALSYSGIKQLHLPEKLAYIGVSAFEECELLTDIYWPSSLTVIDKTAFCGCGFTELRLPEGLQVINEGAFAVCPLKHVYLPKSLLYIDPYAFVDSFYDIEFHVYADTYAEIWVQQNGFSYSYIE